MDTDLPRGVRDQSLIPSTPKCWGVYSLSLSCSDLRVPRLGLKDPRHFGVVSCWETGGRALCTIPVSAGRGAQLTAVMGARSAQLVTSPCPCPPRFLFGRAVLLCAGTEELSWPLNMRVASPCCQRGLPAPFRPRGH